MTVLAGPVFDHVACEESRTAGGDEQQRVIRMADVGEGFEPAICVTHRLGDGVNRVEGLWICPVDKQQGSKSATCTKIGGTRRL